MHSSCPPDSCAGTDGAGVAPEDAGADADEPGPSVFPGPVALGPLGLSVCPGPAVLSVALGPVGASVVLKNGPCVRDDWTALVRAMNVVFRDVWVMVVALAGADVLNVRLVIAGFEDACVAVPTKLVVLPASNDFCVKNGVFVAEGLSTMETEPVADPVPVDVSFWNADEMLETLVPTGTETLLPVLEDIVIVEWMVSKDDVALELPVWIGVDSLELLV